MMRRLLQLYTLLGAAAAGWAALTTGCFDPGSPACAFSCTSEAHACPNRYACEADGLCHLAGTTAAECSLAPATDGGSD